MSEGKQETKRDRARTGDEPAVEKGRYTEPRERDEAGHQDAGQVYVDEHPADKADDES